MPPNQAQILRAEQLLHERRYEQARSLLLPLAQRHPGDRNVALLMSAALGKLGQYEQARFYLQRGLAASPNDPALLANMGQLLREIGRAEEAIPFLRKAVEAGPKLDGAWVNLAGALLSLRRYGQAAATVNEGLRHFQAHPQLVRQGAVALLDAGHAERALALIRQLLQIQPDSPAAASLHAFILNFVPGIPPAEMLQAHRAFGDLLERLRPSSHIQPPPRPSPQDADRPLRIGMISGDFYTHSVAFFAEPLLEHADPAQFSITLYHTATNTDHTSERFKQLAERTGGVWRHAAWLSETALLDTIRQDRIDVLIDLSGHTANNRLPILHQRPAPLQMTWCGYPNTTGVSAIDFRIVDSITDPAPEADAANVEKLIRLDPCFLCYKPLQPRDGTPVPDPAPPPSIAWAPITFGSFNALSKLNEPLLATWKRLLDAVPESRLLLKSVGLAEEEVQREVARRMAAAGISLDRVQLMGPTRTLAEHLALYSQIDVALDHFPYHGTTTTCEALYMGVPVVTMAGPPGVHAARVGASLLHAVGLDELVAADDESYIRIAAALAQDRERLAALRQSLRQRLLNSPLCDAPGFAARFWAMVRAQWRSLATA